MEYIVTYRDLAGRNVPPGITAGVEVQPPLSDAAALGVVAAMTAKQQLDAFARTVGTPECNVADAYVTRNDAVGTAYLLAASRDRRDNSLNATPASLAGMIGQAIDPCKLHRVTYRNADELRN